MEKKELISSLKHRMEGAINVLDNELKGLRAGRASVHLLDPVFVEAYGNRMPVSQLGTVSAPDSRTVIVQVWDASMVKTVEKAIADANLGINSVAEGNTIRLPIPALNEERRKEMAKLAHKYGENAKISIRNIRRDGIEAAKKMEKDGGVSEDELHIVSDDIQKLTDEVVGKVDTMAKTKESEIMNV